MSENIEDKIYIEDEVCDFGHIAKGLYVIRVDIEPFPTICVQCLEVMLKKGKKLIKERQWDEYPKYYES